MLHANIDICSSSAQQRDEALERVALLCLATRTPTGMRMLAEDAVLTAQCGEARPAMRPIRPRAR